MGVNQIKNFFHMEASNQNENANSELGENINNKHTQ
jgi:hypothetical protein